MNEHPFGVKPAVLRCGRCGRFADWEAARLQTVCGCRPHLDLLPVLVRDALPAERDKALQLFRRSLGSDQLVAYGQSVPLDQAELLVAEAEREVAGALAWRRIDGALHILALATDPMWQRSGMGGHLLAEAELLARRHAHPRVVATVTNDNVPALYFYQRRGYRLSGFLRGSLAGRTPDRRTVGFGGIPILDEIELEKAL
jgi:ribosomal protein S18 acetylase RimI-like enzyme